MKYFENIAKVLMIYVYYNDDAYLEVAESLHQAISKLKVDVQLTTKIDTTNGTDQNLFIMFGLNNEVEYLPPHYIAYQLEQTGNEHSWFSENYLRKLRGAREIWDYSLKNIQNLKGYPSLPTSKYVPMGYTSSLKKVDQLAYTKKYDILFYGSACPRRDKMIKSLRNVGLRVYYGEYSLWGEERDRLVAESRIVLNIHYYPSPILETTRLTYLIANSAFVISEPSLDPILDKEYRKFVVFSSYERIVEACQYYLKHEEEREKLTKQFNMNFIEKDYSKSIPIESLNTFLSSHIIKTSTATSIEESTTHVSTMNVTSSTTTTTQLTTSLTPSHETIPSQTTQLNQFATNSTNKKTTLAADSPNMFSSNPFDILQHPQFEENPNDQNKNKNNKEHRGQIRPKFRKAEYTVNENGDGVLKLDADESSLDPQNCPKVSLITPTTSRTWALTSIALRNFYQFDYPKDKLEWIILDSLPTAPVYLPPDPRIKYEVVDNSIPLWKKRNMCVERATGEIIMHLDDDDYYLPESIFVKLQLLKKYSQKNVQCVGNTELGIYHLVDNYSYIATTRYISEASMAYTKKFWENRPFIGKDLEMGEGYAFLKGRESQVIDFPYFYNFIAITHNDNYTQSLRTFRDHSQQNHGNFFNLWDPLTQQFFIELRTKAISKSDENKRQVE